MGPKKQLGHLVEEVREGRKERGDAVVINQILNTREPVLLNLSPNADNTARVYVRVHQYNPVGPRRCDEEE